MESVWLDEWYNSHMDERTDSSFYITLVEKFLILSGVFFFANVLYIASGGGFTFLYVAKIIYVLGILWLAINFFSE